MVGEGELEGNTPSPLEMMRMSLCFCTTNAKIKKTTKICLFVEESSLPVMGVVGESVGNILIYKSINRYLTYVRSSSADVDCKIGREKSGGETPSAMHVNKSIKQ